MTAWAFVRKHSDLRRAGFFAATPRIHLKEVVKVVDDLRAEIERRNVDVDRMALLAIDNARDTTRALQEVELLRAALEKIAAALNPVTYYEPCLELICGDIARAALAGEKNDD